MNLIRVLRTAAAALIAGAVLIQPAVAANPPLKIGFSMPLTGGLAANGRALQLAIQMWAEDVNARGGLLGRKVDLVSYDDQSSAANVPGIYSKLLDVDKVDMVIGTYGTNVIAPAMPVVMQKGKVFMTFFGIAVNDQFKYDRFFNIMPLGPNPAAGIPTGFFEIAARMNPKPTTVAILGADADFGKVTTDAARELAKAHGFKIVYDRLYPPDTVDFASILRSVQAAKPDLVYVGSYPPDTAGVIRATNEIGFKPRLMGAGYVGTQYASLKSQLGPLLNGMLGYETWVPERTIRFKGIEDFIKRYQVKAAVANTDPLGFYVPPYAYAGMQILEQAVKQVGSLDDKALAAYIHKNSFKTVVGDVRFGANGEWDKPRILTVQFRGIVGHDVEQFKKPGREIILWPAEFKSGNLETAK